MYKLTVKKEFVNELSASYCGNIISSSDDVSQIASKILEGEDQEVFLAFFLNVKNCVIGYAEIARGAIDSCAIDQRIIFRSALLCPGCSSIIVSHNHPSGDVQPSKEDVLITKRIKYLGEQLGFTLLDHIIVADNSIHFSFRQKMVDIFTREC